MTPKRMVIAVLLATASRAATPNLDTDSLVEAASMVSVQVSSVEEVRKFCGRKLPGRQHEFDVAAVNWFVKNGGELDAAEAFQDALTNARVRDEQREKVITANATFFMSLKSKDPEQVCDQYLKSWNDGSSDFARATPRASKLLKDYLAAHPLPKETRQRYDAFSTCMQSRIASGSSFDDAASACGAK